MKHWILIVIILLGAGLRWHHATRDIRFHSDEALYSTYARNAAVHGYWMLRGPVDKPPLSIYASALAMHFTAAYVNDLGVIDVPLRQGEFAAKVPNVLAGIVLVPVIYALVLALYHNRRTAHLAALLVAVSPYAVAYSASAFTDMLMLIFMTAAVLAAVRGHVGWSGALLALSFATKPQGILYLPLVIVFIVLADWFSGIFLSDRRHIGNSHHNRIMPQPSIWHPYGGMADRTHTIRRSINRFMLAFLLIILMLLVWDFARPETSVFALGSINISQGRAFTPPVEWLPRLQDWMRDGDNLLGSPLLTVVLIALAIIPVLWRRSWLDWLLLAMVGGYCAVHLIGAFFTFDRYLLPLVPLLAVLAARGIVFLAQVLCKHHGENQPAHISPKSHRTWGATVIIIVLILTAAFATHDPRADAYHGTSQQALIDLAAYLDDKPLGAIIYDRWMGWEIGYYIGAWSDKRRVYYPDPQTQAQDALLNPDPAPRYLIAPANRDYAPWLNSFEDVGFVVSLDYERDGFAVYALIPPHTEMLTSDSVDSASTPQHRPQ